jgi:SAM-dependent methyltransferase
MPSRDTKQAEKEYLGRTGSSIWERTKPFSPAGSDTLAESAQLLHDFSVTMLTLEPSPDDLILDLGAGAGWCSDLLGRLNRSSVAVDLSMEMLRAARSRPGAAIRATAGDMESLPFRSGSFQKAICLSALHHVPNIAAAVRDIARVLDDEGVALFSEPGRGHAEAAVSTAAMRDFGVLEQDIVLERFISLVRTLRLVVEHHPIVVASKRPFAARTPLPPWRAELSMDAPPAAPAGGFARLTVHGRNTGAATWRPASRTGIGHVTLGIQLLDDSGRMIGRDHHRVALPHPVAPGERVTVEVECPMPATAGSYGLKCDLVVEGTTWFEASGSAAVSQPIVVGRP